VKGGTCRYRGGRYSKLAKKELEVHNFFTSLYYSTAETLPHALVVASETDSSVTECGRKRLIQDILDTACSTPLDQQTRGGPSGLSKRHSSAIIQCQPLPLLIFKDSTLFRNVRSLERGGWQTPSRFLEPDFQKCKQMLVWKLFQT
jgi:hypothetical protein